MTPDLQAVAAAVRNRLIARSVAGGVVFDEVPEQTEPPYIEIGESVDVEDDTTLSDGIEHTLTLRAWSRNYKGHGEIRQMARDVRRALHREDLSVAGLSSCICFVDGANYLTDPDGVSHQAVIRCRLMCRE